MEPAPVERFTERLWGRDREAYERRIERMRRRKLPVILASTYGVAAAIAGVVVLVVFYPFARDELVQYGIVGFLGGSVAVGELVSRYKDAPKAALMSTAAGAYLTLNVLAAVSALFIIFRFNWTFGATGEAVLPTQLLVAGFGSLALFRTSLFTVRAGNEDIGIGPSSLLSAILSACDRGVDRVRAKARGWEVANIMADVSFSAAEGPLPAVALGLMQNLPEAEVIALSTEVERLRHQDGLSDDAKALLLGLSITNRVGIDVLEAAKWSLGLEILRPEIKAQRETELLIEAAAREQQLHAQAIEQQQEPLIPADVVDVDAAATEREPYKAEGLPQAPQTP